MFEDPLFILAAVAALIVAVILFVGIGSFGKSGEFHRRNSNRLMRWRLYAQFAAVVLIVFFAWMRSRG